MEEIHPDEMRCPMCASSDCAIYFQDSERCYIRCKDCSLIFVPERFWLSLEEERAEYDLHENRPDDSGYRKFLSRLTVPMLEKLGPGQCGLDFGCGPGPALAAMLQEEGLNVALYDPFYENHPEVFEKQYDFICTTEVVEHLRDPLKEFTRLFSCLKTDGWLGIMTKLTRDDYTDFSGWHYIRDRTHICFYNQQAFDYIADRFGANVEFVGQDVILLQKK